jgi:hypothetical protein
MEPVMHPYIYEQLLKDRDRELERNLRRREVRRARPATPHEAVVLRLDRVQDDEQLARLADLSGARSATGRHVVAEVDGAIVAALPLNGARVLSDPFKRTAHLVPLLELRARQITGGVQPRRRSLGVWRWSRA